MSIRYSSSSSTRKVKERVGKHFWANRDRFFGKIAIWDEDFGISGHRKHYIELNMCRLDRACRVLPWRSMTKLESISRRIATTLTKFDVLSESLFLQFLLNFGRWRCFV